MVPKSDMTPVTGPALVGFNYSIVDYGVDPEIDNSRSTCTSRHNDVEEWAAGRFISSNCSLPDNCLQQVWRLSNVGP